MRESNISIHQIWNCLGLWKLQLNLKSLQDSKQIRHQEQHIFLSSLKLCLRENDNSVKEEDQSWFPWDFIR